MALTGHLSDLSLSELIEFFCNQRKTGALKVLYPQGHGYFYLQSGSVIDARIGVLRGIDAVYYALTLPNAKFEFSGSLEACERTINQPWTQVVLEGLRRLDEGVVPAPAFPPDYVKESEPQESNESNSYAPDFEHLRVPSFLSFINKDSLSTRRFWVGGAVTAVVLLSVAAIGIPAGWYSRASTVAIVSDQPNQPDTAQESASLVSEAPVESSVPAEEAVDSAAVAKPQREKDRSKPREETRTDKPATTTPLTASSTPAPVNPAMESSKPGPKKISVTVTYDESGRVTQASGGDASAIRIARQKRFPAGKAGSATITIPIN